LNAAPVATAEPTPAHNNRVRFMTFVEASTVMRVVVRAARDCRVGGIDPTAPNMWPRSDESYMVVAVGSHRLPKAQV
jgi:hypothetical protein